MELQLSTVMFEGLGTTIIGMAIVFATLALIAFVISLLKYIGKEKPKKEEKAVEPPKPVEEPILETETVEDDLALIAVITASIAASLGTSADKLRVVSIRKEKSSSWINASRREQQRHIY